MADMADILLNSIGVGRSDFDEKTKLQKKTEPSHDMPQAPQKPQTPIEPTKTKGTPKEEKTEEEANTKQKSKYFLSGQRLRT